MANSATRKIENRYIYIAGPWAPLGGGMFKVADYLIQSQEFPASGEAAELRRLDTRGGATAIFSLWVLAIALFSVLRGRLSGRLVGLHVNMAERLSVFRKGVLIMVARSLGLPVVLHLHAAQLQQFYGGLPRTLQAMTRWIFSLASSCIVLGPTAKRFVTDELKVPSNRVEIVINGVPQPSEPRRKADAHSIHRVLFVGNLSERKGISDLLQALTLNGFNLSRLEVCIAGGGDVEAYQKKALALGINHFVQFLGWCDQQHVARLMAQADVLVLPSYDEGLPLVILEALANGVCVVCSPVGEIPAVLSDGITALFVAPGDVQTLAVSVQRVLEQPALREALEINGRALYIEQFSMSHFFASVAKVHRKYFGVAARAPHSSPERDVL